MPAALRKYFIEKLFPNGGPFLYSHFELTDLAARDSEFAAKWSELLALRGGNLQATKEMLRNSVNGYFRDHPADAARTPQYHQVVFDPATKQFVARTMEGKGKVTYQGKQQVNQRPVLNFTPRGKL
jgi:hypothetical protein